MTAKRYGAAWGLRIWLFTGAAIVVAVGVVIGVFLRSSNDDPKSYWARRVVPVILFGVIGGTSLWMIRRFEITNDAIVVRRGLWSNRIALSDIESAELDAHACRGAWKTCGNDGLFAMHGQFRSRRLGKFQAYVTQPRNAIVLRVAGDTIVISPDNPRNFLKELNHRRSRLKEKR